VDDGALLDTHAFNRLCIAPAALSEQLPIITGDEAFGRMPGVTVSW
jgi:predicted nucleic acid-binding protein